MATISERAAAAVLGCLVADAAAQPIHWIYDLAKLEAVLSTTPYPEFRVPSANPYYRLDTGRLTSYGDQMYTLLESLVRCKELDPKDYAAGIYRCYGPDSEYENKLNAAFVLKSGVQEKYPIEAAWRNTVFKDFIKKYEAGAEDTGGTMEDMHAVVQVVPIVALYAGRPEMLDRVEEAISVTMTADGSIVQGLAAARMVEHFILHGSEGNFLEAVLKEMRNPERRNAHSLDNAVISFLEEVKRNAAIPHTKVATEVFKNH